MEFIRLSYSIFDEAQRLDAYLSTVYPALSRRHWRSVCEQGKVRVNNRRVKPGTSLKFRDLIVFQKNILPSKAAASELEGLAELVFEDQYLLVVCKQKAVHSVRQTLGTSVTLADWIVNYCPSCEEASSDSNDSGLLGRLDFYTSGLLLVAKTRESWQRLSTEQKAGKFRKEYLALCEGRVPMAQFDIDRPLIQSRSGTRMELAENTSNAFPARTSLVSAKHLSEDTSLVRLSGSSFRRHQLRIHMSSIGHPLIGDEKYGSTRKLAPIISRDGFFLHSCLLGFVHPFEGKSLEFESLATELPENML